MTRPTSCTHGPRLPGRRTLLRRCAVGAAGLLPIVAAGEARPAIVQPANPGPQAFMARAFLLRERAILRGDQPFGAVVVRDGRIVGEAASAVVVANDPTAHAEMEAIRDAARRLGTRDLSGCELYGTSRACPMCEGAAYWARIARLRHGEAIVDAGAPR